MRHSALIQFLAILSLFGCGVRGHAVERSTILDKVFVGYQGWFRCPGDGSPQNAWSHWSKGAPSAATLSVDLYPDVSELDEASRCTVPGMTIQGHAAQLFSSFPRPTTEKHFAWMKAYAIDGALMQRFINSIPMLRDEHDTVLRNALAAAEHNDRLIAVEYDLTGGNRADRAPVLQRLQEDWQYLVREVGVTKSPAYVRQGRKPLVSIWGLGFGDGRHIDDPKLALSIIRWFKRVAHVTVMGGVPAGWGTLSTDSVRDPAWAKVYSELDVVQPWTVGRYKDQSAADAWKASHLVPDLSLTRKNHQIYMPVIFPGFSWHNLFRDRPENQIPRKQGTFFWTQAYNVYAAGARTVKIAMFDEVNEGTAIFKAASARTEAPEQGYWLTLDADGTPLPPDWYLRIAQRIAGAFHGKQSLPATMPSRLE